MSYLVVRTKQYELWGALYQVFSCPILRSASVSELIVKLYKVEIYVIINSFSPVSINAGICHAWGILTTYMGYAIG